MADPDMKAIEDDVLHGLSQQSHRLNDAIMSQDFWDYRGKKHMAVFMKDAETPFDYIQRPYRPGGLLRQVVTKLCEHLYSPGPSRMWDDATGEAFLQQVYRDNHFDAIMLRADQLSTLNDVCAIQVDAGEGKFGEKPITLRPWGADAFHAWTDPEDRTVPKVVCTIDRYVEREVYRLWTDKVVRTYEITQEDLVKGDRATTFKGQEDHDYGCLPFAFVHAEQPITTFWETGPGGLVLSAEIRTNDRMSRLDESINKHLNPIPVAENVADDFQVILEAQRFVKIRSSMMVMGATGGYQEGPQARLYYLSVIIDSMQAWDDCRKYVNTVLKATGVPLQMDGEGQITVDSGIGLVIQESPLLTRARKRRQPFTIYENCIAKTILQCAGGHYRKQELIASAKKGLLTLGWAMPSVPVPTPDNLELLIQQVSAGFKSLPMAIGEWSGVDREGAFKILEQIAEDEAEMKARVPDLHARMQPVQQDRDIAEQDARTDEIATQDQDESTGASKDLVMEDQ